jgi:hypothetical protein
MLRLRMETPAALLRLRRVRRASDRPNHQPNLRSIRQAVT